VYQAWWQAQLWLRPVIQPMARWRAIFPGGLVMLQANEIEQRFERISEAIGQASKACDDGNMSPDLKDCIDRLDRQSGAARAVLQSHDDARIRDCVNDLEMLGDEAKRVVHSDHQAPAQLCDAVDRVHDQLSDLKHQLH
jgi:hypothetical protein